MPGWLQILGAMKTLRRTRGTQDQIRLFPFLTVFIRVSWRQGGAPERFLLLIYPAWLIYFAGIQILIVKLINSPNIWFAFFLVGISFLGLLPMWVIPLATNEKIMRALAASGVVPVTTEIRKALIWADYFKNEEGGKWALGLRFSLEPVSKPRLSEVSI